MRYFKTYSSFQWPYPFNTKANLENLGIILFLRAQGIRKSIHHLRILMFSFEMCVCAWLKIGNFQRLTISYYSMLLFFINKRYIDGIAVSC